MTDGTKYEAEARTDIENGRGLYEAFVEIDGERCAHCDWDSLDLGSHLSWDTLAKEIYVISANGRAARANHKDAERRLTEMTKVRDYAIADGNVSGQKVALLRDVIRDIMGALRP